MADAHKDVRWGILTGNLSALLGDSQDPALVPDERGLYGTIRATPIGADEAGRIVPIRELRIPAAKRMHWIEDVEIQVIDGLLAPVDATSAASVPGIGMVASIQPNGSPNHFSWLLEFNIPGTDFADRVIDIAPDVETDLSSAVPAVPIPGTVVVVSDESRLAAEAAAGRAEAAAEEVDEAIGNAATEAANQTTAILATHRAAAEAAAQSAAQSAQAAQTPTNTVVDARITAKRGVAEGVASLDGSTRVPINQIPVVALAATTEMGAAIGTEVGKVFTAQKGKPSGIASLDSAGLIPTAQVPMAAITAEVNSKPSSTGSRNIATLFPTADLTIGGSSIRLMLTGNMVEFTLGSAKFTTTSVLIEDLFPVGFRPTGNIYAALLRGIGPNVGELQVTRNGRVWLRGFTAGEELKVTAHWLTNDPFPTTYPGTAIA